MILSDKEIQERVESPLNLLNRLRRTSLQVTSPSLPPKSEDILKDLDEKIKLGTVRSTAASIMVDALAELKLRIPDVQKPEKLAQIAAEMNKVVQSRDDSDDKKAPQVIVYAPQLVQESYFQEITIKE